MILEEEKKKFFDFIDNVLSGEIYFKEWSTKFINDLPDEAFAIILPGGEKDEEGKTKPRSLRKLPHHTPDVKDGTENETVDLPHLRNALARLPQADMPEEYRQRAKRHLIAHAKALGVGDYDNTNEKGGVKMEDTRLKELESKLRELTEVRAKEQQETKELMNKLEEKYQTQMNQLEEKYQKQLEELTSRLKESEIKLNERDKELRKERVDRICSGLLQKGIWPAVVEKVRGVLLSDIAYDTIKLSENEEKTLSEVLLDIIDTIPEEVRLDFSDKGKQARVERNTRKFMGEEEVARFAEERNISYEEACVELAKEGKIEI